MNYFQIVSRFFGFLFLPLLLVLPVQAFENDAVPAYYRVFDVGSTGSLKIRAQAMAGGTIIGEYALAAGPIEILKIENGWGNVVAGDGNGWVNMAHLIEIPVPMVGQTSLPEGLLCSGTEPFWGFQLGSAEIVLSRMGEDDQTYSIIEADLFEGRTGPDGFVQAAGTSGMLFAIISARQCSDGMSDRAYGWWVNLLETSLNDTSAVNGCCSLSM